MIVSFKRLILNTQLNILIYIYMKILQWKKAVFILFMSLYPCGFVVRCYQMQQQCFYNVLLFIMSDSQLNIFVIWIMVK